MYNDPFFRLIGFDLGWVSGALEGVPADLPATLETVHFATVPRRLQSIQVSLLKVTLKFERWNANLSKIFDFCCRLLIRSRLFRSDRFPKHGFALRTHRSWKNCHCLRSGSGDGFQGARGEKSKLTLYQHQFVKKTFQSRLVKHAFW